MNDAVQKFSPLTDAERLAVPALAEEHDDGRHVSPIPETKDIVTPYEPTPNERAAMVAYVARKKEKPLAPRMKVSENGGVSQIAPDHPEAAVAQVLLMEAIGAKDLDFLDGLPKQLVNAGTQGSTADEHGLNFMLSVVKGIEPKDQVEAMLAAQMAAVYMSTMTFARRLAHVENIRNRTARSGPSIN